MDVVLCSILMLRPPAIRLSNSFISAGDRFPLLPILRMDMAFPQAASRRDPVTPNSSPGAPWLDEDVSEACALFTLDKSFITKVKLSVRNYTAKLFFPKKHSPPPSPFPD